MKKKFIIGIDLGGTNLKVALLNESFDIVRKDILGTKLFRNKEDLIKAIVRSVKDILIGSRLSKNDILGIGIGVPGPVDIVNGNVHFLPNIPGWKNVSLRKILSKKIGLPIFIDNDAKVMAIAEYNLGKARGLKNVLCVTLGTGVGGGLILNGNIYRGSNNASAEIGHLPINENGPRCNCGGIACLEAYVGNRRIEEYAKRDFCRNISLEELSRLARNQNRKALKIWSKVGGHLGVALAATVNLLNLDAIVIGGGVANAGAVLFDKVRETIKKRAMSVQANSVRVLKAQLGSSAGLIGAAMLVKNGLRNL